MIKRPTIRLAIIVGFLFFLIYFFGVPFSFPAGQIITISEGVTADEVGRTLEENRFIRSDFVFRLLLWLGRSEDKIKAGDYIFERALSVFTIISRLTKPIFGIGQIKVTIPEGTSAPEMAEIFAGSLSQFDRKEFLTQAVSKEGYLFPDTYFFFANATSGDVIAKMENNFERKILTLNEVVQKSGRTLREIIIMASLIEEEAHEPTDRRIISGILWKRLDLGMALQVDAAPGTYEIAGLPPEPITNPGLDAIEAALDPTKTNHLYYLSGSDGQTYYAETFEEHKVNKEKYLR